MSATERSFQFPDGGTKPGAFATAAVVLSRMGLAVLPLGGEKGQTPLVKNWNKWKHPPGLPFIEKMISEHPYANIGIACGPSNVTINDDDDPNILQYLIDRFGDTPLKTHTPRGGVHLWYRNNGERCDQPLRKEGLAADIKGIGGFVVVPPSIRWGGEFAGREYGFLSGCSWDDLRRLPTIRPGALLPRNKISNKADNIAKLRIIHEGLRNTTLFLASLRHAKACDSLDALYDVAQTINADFLPPLGDNEVQKIVSSAWKYEITGRNRVSQEARVHTLKSEWERLAAHPNGGDGMILYQHLLFHHSGRDTFAISPKPMAAAASIPGWSDPRRYQRARDAIREIGLIAEMHKGGRGVHDPSLFCLLRKGAISVPNITKTPSLASPLPAVPTCKEAVNG